MENKEQEVQKKIVVYQKALEDVKKQLIDRRAELVILAATTVANYEAQIPDLYKKIDRLNTEIKALEELKKDRQAKYEAQKVSCQEEYELLIKNLRSEYSAKMSALKDSVDSANELNDKYLERSRRLATDQNSLSADREDFKNKECGLLKDKESFELEKASYRSNISALKSELSGAIEKAKTGQLDIQNKKDEVSRQDSVLKDRLKEADVILARIDEAQGILNSANKKEEENKKEEIRLNAERVKVMADQRNNSVRARHLDERDAELTERKRNLEILEAKVGR